MKSELNNKQTKTLKVIKLPFTVIALFGAVIDQIGCLR